MNTRNDDNMNLVQELTKVLLEIKALKTVCCKLKINYKLLSARILKYSIMSQH